MGIGLFEIVSIALVASGMSPEDAEAVARPIAKSWGNTRVTPDSTREVLCDLRERLEDQGARR